MANTVVKMPQLGESVSEGTIGRWLKQPGERVERDEPLVEIQTDKVNAEVPSPVAGILQQILLPEGTTAAVKSDMAIIGDEQVVAAETPAPVDLAAAQGPEGTTAERTPAQSAATAPPPLAFTYDKAAGGGVVGQRDDDPPARGAEPQPVPNDQPLPAANGVKRFYTPVVLRIAEEHALDLSQIQGSGAHGRVTRKDVERAIAGQPQPPANTAAAGTDAAGSAAAGSAAAGSDAAGTAAAGTDAAGSAAAGSAAAGSAAAGSASPFPSAVPMPTAWDSSLMAPMSRTSPATPPATSAPSGSPPAGAAPTTTVPSNPPPATSALSGADETRLLSPMRRAIAEHMTRARADIPDAWSLTEIDVTNLVRQRQKLQPDWQAREGFELTYLPFFVKAVLAGLRAVPELNATFAGDHLTVHAQYHLGIAVSLDNGLVVPVLRDADQLSLAGVARALRTLIQKARAGKLTIDDLQGATFTVNNPGSLGSIMSQPIVPVGQAGIVTMEAIVKRPIVTADDAIAIRSMMNSCLSFDHRILDGAGALKFLRTLKTQLETVELPLY